MRRLLPRIVAVVLLAACPAARAAASPESQALRARASAALYNLDRDEAIALFRQAIAADPADAGAYRGLAGALWMSITFARGTMTVDSYLGRITRQDLDMPPPPPEAASAFDAAVTRATELARARLEDHPRDADAHYQLGAAVGLRASYAATVDGSVRRAFGAAREAYNAHEKVLELNPARRDAGLIVGSYRYIVAAMALPLRMVAYIAGFGGGREKGIQLIEAAAEYPGDNRADARLALVLLYNRERRYDEALEHLAALRAAYPRNRLLWLETAATALRAGRAAEAEAFLDEGISRLAHDTRPRMFGEEALWFHKRGLARAALGKVTEAELDLRHALSLEARGFVRARTHLELGRIALKRGDNAAARRELEAALAEAERDRDHPTADAARHLLD